MKPKSSHWADVAAARIVGTWGELEQYVLASGITPSGTVHIGNFREVITVDLVARALRDVNKKVRFIYSWDDFDTFRKVPKNLPQQDMLQAELRRPISRIPDPHGECASYAAYNISKFEADLKQVGIEPDFLYQEQRYSAGLYAESMLKALQAKDQIAAILNQFRKEPLSPDWLPTAIYCESCGRDEMNYERYQGDWNYAYHCKSCDHQTVTDIRKTKNLKLNWRTDWPMRWAFEGVHFEPGGKDHSSQGGSFDTAKQIVESVWNRKAPVYLQYDFVSIKGLGGKMSSSAGVLLTLNQALQVYTPQMVRWIFASQKPNHDFSLAFDQDVIKTYEEFDRTESEIYTKDPDQAKVQAMRRIYELASVDGAMPQTQPQRPSFRDLCNRLQITGGDIERCYQRFYAEAIPNEEDRKLYYERARCAWNWIENFAPEEFRYRLRTEKLLSSENEQVIAALQALHELIVEVDLDAIDAAELNQMIYDRAIKANECQGKEFFAAVYDRLIGRNQGPRLPSFLKEIGKEQILKLI